MVDKKGDIQIHGRRGVPLAAIPTPMMWDSKSAKQGGPPQHRQVGVSITHTASAKARQGLDATDPVNVTLKPDQKWLTNPDTVYPVTIDPDYEYWSVTAASTTVVKGYDKGWSEADTLFVGTYDDTWSARSFVTWWATGIAGWDVSAATLHLASPYSRAYYDRKRAEGKKHNAALICLARRRVDVLNAMLRTQSPYQPKTADQPHLAA